MESLSELRQMLSLVVAAHSLARQGASRATVTEVVAAVDGESIGVAIAGQLLARLGVKTVRSGSRSRLVLDSKALSDMRSSLEFEIKAAELALGATEAEVERLVMMESELEERLARAQSLRQRIRGLQRNLTSEEKKLAKLREQS